MAEASPLEVDKDPFTLPHEGLKDIRIVNTIIEGKIVFLRTVG